jgi:hypothetical protein
LKGPLSNCCCRNNSAGVCRGTFAVDPFGSDSAWDLLEEVESLPSGERLDRMARVRSSGRDQGVEVEDVLPDELIAAAAIVVANIPGGADVVWNSGVDGISTWLPEPVSMEVTSLSVAALDEALPENGWWWQSWKDDADRERMRSVVVTLKNVLGLTGRTTRRPGTVTRFGDWLSEMATRIDQLTTRSKVALFIACAHALLPGYRHWLALAKQANNEAVAEPLTQATSERLYGVSDVGSGSEEDAQIRAILHEPDMSAALDFVTWAVDHLTDRAAPSGDDLSELTSRAVVIAP